MAASVVSATGASSAAPRVLVGAVARCRPVLRRGGGRFGRVGARPGVLAGAVACSSAALSATGSVASGAAAVALGASPLGAVPAGSACGLWAPWACSAAALCSGGVGVFAAAVSADVVVASTGASTGSAGAASVGTAVTVSVTPSPTASTVLAAASRPLTVSVVIAARSGSGSAVSAASSSGVSSIGLPLESIRSRSLGSSLWSSRRRTCRRPPSDRRVRMGWMPSMHARIRLADSRPGAADALDVPLWLSPRERAAERVSVVADTSRSNPTLRPRPRARQAALVRTAALARPRPPPSAPAARAPLRRGA